LSTNAGIDLAFRWGWDPYSDPYRRRWATQAVIAVTEPTA
jgi:hypothetical protein